MDDLTKRLLTVLDKRKENHSFRVLKNYSSYIDFLSNDYLGLAKQHLLHFENSEPNGGSSRLIAGTSTFHIELEQFLAHYFNAQTALLFNSGYDANVGLLSAIPKKGDIVIYDELCHASIKDGLQLSQAKRFKFKHNNISDLERLLTKYVNHTVFVVVEGLYSMDGDFASLQEIDNLIQKHKAYLILDEAHSAGSIGKDGTGLTDWIKIKPPFARIITFGKAFGAHGACILCSQVTKDYLINFARSFIYTTALPIFIVKQIHFNIINANFEILQDNLQSNIDLFRKSINNQLIHSDKSSPIQIIKSSDLNKLIKIEKELLAKGFGVKAILSPTVKKGNERLRISIHSTHKPSDIKKLASILSLHF